MPWEGRSEKILAQHRERLAVVYVRQSTPQQVLNHQESTRLQYSLQSRAQQLGWPAERVLVIDDDLGKSGATAEGRMGFQRLVSEVSLGHVGIILGVEMSRLARSCKDWHQLLEVCALFGALIADLDGIYDPASYNDRLLLGLKGTMSEAELHILKQRMNQGRLNKARRGALLFALPIGYVRGRGGEVTLDPDEQVQQVVRLIFRKFEELATINALLQYLVAHQVQLGVRSREGQNKGELEWHRPVRMTLQHMLQHPLYAGAYAYGRSQVDPRRKKPGRPSTGRRVMERRRWLVLLKDRFPAYISWEHYERNLAQMQANRCCAQALGAPRHGPALLSGLLICARCGNRMTVCYSGAPGHHTYLCARQRIEYGAPRCQSLAGPPLDQFISARVLEALTPAALELSLGAAEHLQQERAELDALWRQRLERATYEAERAARSFRLVEPENRLVARQLEHDWEEKLLEKSRLEEEYRRVEQHQPRLLTELERQAIRQLAADIPALWAATSTTGAEQKQILRQVIDKVIVDAQGRSEAVHLTIHWAGGMQTEASIVRPVAKLDQLSYYPQLCARTRILAEEGLRAHQIAERLNCEGFRPPKRSEKFGPGTVRRLLDAVGFRRQPYSLEAPRDLAEHEWLLPELAATIPMPPVTLYNWLRRGWVKGRQQETAPHRWLIWADEKEVERLRHRHQQPVGFYLRRTLPAGEREWLGAEKITG
jgi:DNA invertase Pin-like site-specific DNA recombinase